MPGFDDLLTKMRDRSRTTKQLGDWFEAACVEFLKYDSDWGWKDVRHPRGRDLGIDLVGHDRDGRQWAVQCKCYEDALHYEGGVTNLWVESDKKEIPPGRRIIMTTGRPTATLHKQCAGTGVRIIRPSDMDRHLDWSSFSLKTGYLRPPKHMPQVMREHQQSAYDACIGGLEKGGRGQLIMACGTGKTLVAQRIAEHEGGLCVYLVPSISLARQARASFLENYEGRVPPATLTICSDKSAGGNEDISTVFLPGMVTTNKDEIREWCTARKSGVVFCTYQSCELLKGLDFKLAIFDEAHRTTGRTDRGFAFCLDDENVRCRKRLFQTATPRIYKGEKPDDVEDMVDDENGVYGPRWHTLSFSDAIEKGILADYEVLAFEMPVEELARMQSGRRRTRDSSKAKNGTKEADKEADLETATRMRSVLHALIHRSEHAPQQPLGKVMVFHNTIKASKQFAGAGLEGDGWAQRGFKEFQHDEPGLSKGISIKVEHADGKDKAANRAEKLQWLEDSDKEPGDIRLLSNVRCFSEGVDVPSLDAVVFFEPRKSVIDVIQSVGRVMRGGSISGGKSKGYVIIPIAVSKDAAADHTLSDTKSSYDILRQVVLALRAHDDRIEDWLRMVSLARRADGGVTRVRESTGQNGDDGKEQAPLLPDPLPKAAGRLLYGIRLLDAGFYWDDYGRRLGEHAALLRVWLERQEQYGGLIDDLHRNLRGVVGITVSRDDALEVLAQHAVLTELFNTLFPGSKNRVADALGKSAVGIEWPAGDMQKIRDMHADMRRGKIDGIRRDPAKMRNLVNKVYENFFRGFYGPTDMRSKTIVYTPSELSGFIVRSVDHILKTEFGADLATCMDVQILDPAAGTGSFLTSVLQHCGGIEGGGVTPDYRRLFGRLHFCELKLLAYYTACANIESEYRRRVPRGRPRAFGGGLWADTLTIPPDASQVRRRGGVIAEQAQLTDESWNRIQRRRHRQRDRHIHVIIGNPPWSGGARTASESVGQVEHPDVERRIRETYMERIPDTVTMKRGVLNEYAQFLRWTSDRIGNAGVIGMVLPSGWLHGNSEAGIRACLAEEFTGVWVYDLRGNAKLSREARLLGGEKIFGSQSMSAVCLLLLVKNPERHGRQCVIKHAEVGDYMSREDKLRHVAATGSIDGITTWNVIKPDKYHDWVNQQAGMDDWEGFIPIGTLEAKKEYGMLKMTDESMRSAPPHQPRTIFAAYSRGILTGRDEWMYDSGPSLPDTQTDSRPTGTSGYTRPAHQGRRVRDTT